MDRDGRLLSVLSCLSMMLAIGFASSWYSVRQQLQLCEIEIEQLRDELAELRRSPPVVVPEDASTESNSPHPER